MNYHKLVEDFESVDERNACHSGRVRSIRDKFQSAVFSSLPYRKTDSVAFRSVPNSPVYLCTGFDFVNYYQNSKEERISLVEDDFLNIG